MARHIQKIFVIRFHKNLIKAISTQGIFTIVLDGENKNLMEFENPPDRLKSASWDLIDSMTIFNFFRKVQALSKLIKFEKPDIIHVNALQDLVFTFIAVHLSPLLKKRPAIIVMSRNPLTWTKPIKSWLVVQFIRLFSDGFVSLANTHKSQLLTMGFPKEMLAVIPNPYDIDQMKLIEITRTRLPANPDNLLRIIYVANICERKAQDILIRAAAFVLRQHPNVTFDLVGEVIKGEERYAEEIYTLTQELNIATQVHFVGALPYPEVISMLANSDIVAFPSRAEMMPRAVIEAMVAGKPVVASAVDGILDLIKNRETGILVQPGDPEELAQALCDLINNPTMADELGRKGQKFILEFSSPERVGGLFCDFYQMILDRV